MDRISRAGGLILQLVAVAAALAALALCPPLRGRMTLVPVTAGAGTLALRTALDHGAGLVGRCPYAGSFVISGELSQLALPLLATGAMLLAAPGGCGEGQA